MRKSIQIIALAASLVSMQVWVPSTHATLTDPSGLEAIWDLVGFGVTMNEGFGTIRNGSSMAGSGSGGGLIALNDGNSSLAVVAEISWHGTGNYVVSFDYYLAGHDSYLSYIQFGSVSGTTKTFWTSGGSWQHYSETWSLEDSLYGRFFVSAGAQGDYAVANVKDLSMSPVPVPSALLLLGSGLVGLVGIGRRRTKK